MLNFVHHARLVKFERFVTLDKLLVKRIRKLRQFVFECSNLFLQSIILNVLLILNFSLLLLFLLLQLFFRFFGLGEHFCLELVDQLLNSIGVHLVMQSCLKLLSRLIALVQLARQLTNRGICKVS